MNDLEMKVSSGMTLNETINDRFSNLIRESNSKYQFDRLGNFLSLSTTSHFYFLLKYFFNQK